MQLAGDVVLVALAVRWDLENGVSVAKEILGGDREVLSRKWATVSSVMLDRRM